MNTISGSTPAVPVESPQVAKLLGVAKQLEGVFVRQMFAAMRATVPGDGGPEGGAGEEMFTGMMDEHVADSMAMRLDDGIAAHIVQQMRARLEPSAPGKTT